MTDKQKEIIKRLLACSQTTVECCKQALSNDATEHDIKVACLLAQQRGIK